MNKRPSKLLNIDTNAKTVKGRKLGFITGILYLAPANLSGFEVCPQRSPGCTDACLNTAGRGTFSNVQASRIAKTHWYFQDRPGFMYQLIKEIAALVRKAEREGLTPVVRLNGTSDIPWERVQVGSAVGGLPGAIARMHDRGMIDAGDATVFDLFPVVQFYDYTKITKRALAHARGEMPANYHLTFSRTEDNHQACYDVLAAGGNVAMVFADKLPAVWEYADWGRRRLVDVIDGDADDARFIDDKRPTPQGFASSEHRGVIVGLKAKGKARKDTSGFVVR